MSQRENTAPTPPPRNLAQRGWLVLLAVYMLALIVVGVVLEPRITLWSGLLRIAQSPGILVSDYTTIGGLGAAQRELTRASKTTLEVIRRGSSAVLEIEIGDG